MHKNSLVFSKLNTIADVRYCDDCSKSQEVCVSVTEGAPVCQDIKDPLDPTGCGGLCLLNEQICLRIDKDAYK